MVLERPELFSSDDWGVIAGIVALLLTFSLTLEYLNYREWSRFNDVLVDAEVVTQYLKTKETRRYSVLKLKSDDGALFYTTGSDHLRNLVGYRVRLRAFTKRLNFLDYLRGFYVFSRIEAVYPERSQRIAWAEAIASQFNHPFEGQIYAALLTASPLEHSLRERLSALGISHLMAISGFHIGVLSLLLLGMFMFPLKWVQSRWFPYINRRREQMLLILPLLFSYVWFLDFVPSVSRAFAMTVVGFILYDRGIKIVSMQTLAIVVVLLVALWPRLGFSVGFWLSVGGVFYILLFLKRFATLGPVQTFVGIHLWVYLMMLPMALYLFETFSPMHPLSIVWSMLFLLYYPLVLGLHAIGGQGLLEGVLLLLLKSVEVYRVSLSAVVVLLHGGLSIAAVWSQRALWLLFAVGVAIFVGAVYEVAHL